MTKTVILIGAGNMGYAMLKGWLRSNPQPEVFVVEPSEEHRKRAANLGVNAFQSVRDIPSTNKADLVVIAVKPQGVIAVLGECAGLAQRGAAFLSLAAGVKIATIRAALPSSSHVIRCMPNTPAAIGEGMMVLCADGDTLIPWSIRQFAETLMGAAGKVAWVPRDDLMDAVTAISGSGPAYVFCFVEALTSAGIGLGLNEETALLLAKQTVAGAGRMVLEAEASPSVLREQVTSPNGTTAAALAVLMDTGDFTDLIGRAVIAARDRGVELGRTG